MFKKYKSKKAFTLVEFLTAALIVAVLAAIATPIFRKAILKARAAEAINLLTQVRTKQYQNYARNKAYFMDFGNMAGKLTNSDEIRDANNASRMRIGDYEIELVGDSDCAIAYYKPNGATEAEFSFSISYLKNGLGCDGPICQGFGDVIGGVDDVCASVEQAEYTCSNNFDPSTCSFPKVIGIDGCSCVCSDGRRTECQGIEGATWNEESCECTVPDCIQPASPDPNNDSYWWDEEGCTWRCALTLNACGERESYSEGNCSCVCTYGRDSNGHCSCPGDQIWDGQTCVSCEYNFYTVSDDINACCTDDKPIFNGIECVACPAKSHWNPETRICECANVVNGVCECPTETPMWSGTECVACAYQFYTPVGDIGVCCTAATPVASGNSCVACPAYSTFDLTEKKCVCNTGHVPAYDGNGVLTSCGCPEGTNTGFLGGVVVGACKCPANTNTTQTGGEVGTTGCHCPEGMQWLAEGGVNGGRCVCSRGEEYTRYGAWYHYSGNNNLNRILGRECCPEGTRGYTYNSSGSSSGTYTSGYNGALVTGTANGSVSANMNPGACFCPTNAGPKGNASYQGGEVNASCNCKNGMVWNSETSTCDCPTGTNVGFLGGYVEEDSLCRCPANTTPANTGGYAVHENCRCPEGMQWLAEGGVNGGRCVCSRGEEYTRYGAWYHYSGNNNLNRILGRECCPEGTRGYTYNSSGSSSGTYTSGYNGALVTGTANGSVSANMNPGACFCPTNAGPQNATYNGEQINGTVCYCKTGMVWNSETNVCECPVGTNVGYVGGVESEGSQCKCPANTNTTNTGGATLNENCHCPEGTKWVTGTGKDGGHCECIAEPARTIYGSNKTGTWNSGRNFNGENTIYGRGCCAVGTYGWALNASNPQTTQNINGIQYNGANVLSGANETNGRCLCPTNAGPQNATYNGEQINGTVCYCKTGMVWNSETNVCECPVGTNVGYVGGVESEGSQCKCPANTNTTNTGGATLNENCHCPEGTKWVTGTGKDGGHCECIAEPARTIYGSNKTGTWNSGRNFNGENTIYGRGCCAVGTYGWALNASNPQTTQNINGIQYNGANVLSGANEINGRCLCPTGTGPRTSESYQGTPVNATCACPTGTTWYEGSGCLKCPPGSTWNEHCGTCLCNQTDGYSTWGPYDQTNGCTQKMCKGVGYFDTNTCSCGCLVSDTEYDSDLECCRCPAQAGINHDANHDINGCYIGD